MNDTKLAGLLDAFVEEMLVISPETATGIGLDKGARAGLKSKLDDRSAAGRANQIAGYADRARRLRAIPRAGLSGRDITTYDTVLYAMDLGAEGGRFAYGRDVAGPYVVSQQDGVVANLGEFLNSQHLIETRADCDAYLARLDSCGVALDQESARIADAAGRGVVPPDFLLPTAVDQIAALRAQPAGSTRLVASLDERARARGLGDYAGSATAIVAGKIFPALERQLAAVKALQARATHDAGCWKFPDGADYYRWALKYGTTTDRTAADVHRMGLDQGAAIDGEMDKILKSQGYTQGTVGARMSALTQDPKFLYPDTVAGRAELIAYLNGRIAAIRPYLPKISKLGLQAPVQVRAVPKEIEVGAGLGYMNFAAIDGSRPAIYYVNLHDMSNWPRYSLSSLTMHEALPGHAWQGAYLAEVHDEIHTIASLIGFNAFIEGWALYAEQLADEVGLYKDDPLGRLGYWQAMRFRAARLVVDTGLHDQRWTREHAVRWMTAATGRSVAAITSEVDRYCAGPGQACGYKVGHTEIVRLREKAKAALGPRFDLRDYDDAVVTTGGTPLSVLESVIDRYVAGARPA
ncbi:DUF885 family protein [Phenylobacterium sp.]|uniref:DUF885 domain-containing protein n=1 Tax=Phenylobacterium sp. TaxID=1871053 RepID=UPI0025F6BBD9|nr:DUF885 family protein [Phenylobacterium sp.]